MDDFQTIYKNVQIQKVDKDNKTITVIYPYTLFENVKTQEGIDIMSLINSKVSADSPTFTGVPKTPTPDGTTIEQVTNVQFVRDEIERKIEVSEAMRYKGTVGVGGTITTLPDTHAVGDTYKVISAGTYAGQKCEIGDTIISIVTRTSGTPQNSDWTVIQANIDGAVIGPSTSTNNHVAMFDGATGKLIKDTGITVEKSVPIDAKFTDTTYSEATTTQAGLMSAEDKIKLDASLDEITISTEEPTDHSKMWINLNGDVFLSPEEKFNIHSYTSDFTTNTRLLDHNEYRINYPITSCSIKIPTITADDYKTRLILLTGNSISFTYEDLSGYGVYFKGDDCANGNINMQSNKIYIINFTFIGLTIVAKVDKIDI